MPTSSGLHLFNIRVQNSLGTWGPVFKKTVYLGDSQRDLKILSAEYYWDNGVGTPLIVFDGNFDEAIEEVFKDNITMPTSSGLHLFNIRVQNSLGTWGPVFKKPTYLTQFNLQVSNLNNSDTICKGEFIDLKINGGINPVWYGQNLPIIQDSTRLRIQLQNSTQFMVIANNPFSGLDTAFYTIHVENNPNVSILNSLDTICNGDSLELFGFGANNYSWDSGSSLASSIIIKPSDDSTIVVNGYSTFGCSNQDSLRIFVKQNSLLNITDSSCNFSLNGQTYSSSGIYQQDFINSVGCDSTIIIELIDNPTFSDLIVDTSCYNLTVNGQTFNQSGNYQQILTNSKGCDSIVSLDLTITNSSSFTQVFITCDSLEWNGSTYFTSGNQTFTTTNAAGCDSIVNLVLTVNNSSSSLLAISSCNSYNWNGNTYFTSGVYRDSLQSTTGCDSVVTLDLTITTSSTLLTQSSCDSFSWNGTDYTTSGTYYSASGTCVDTLFLTVNSSTSSLTDLVSCDSLEWNGFNYLTSGTYTYTTINSVGCDSTATLNLTINNSETNTTDAVIIACDNYTWSGDGNTYNASGNYQQILTNSSGCDSIVSLDLIINNSSSFTEVFMACDSLEWNGFTYFTSGNQTFTTTNAAGCDSIANLVLTLNNSSSSFLTTSSCNSYDWNGTTYSSSGVYENISVNSSGCTQTDTLDLTITTSSTSLTQSSCDLFSWNGTDYTTSGTYYSASGTCVDTLFLTVNSSTSSVTDLVSCDSLEWNGLNYLTSGTYTYTTTNSVGCDSTATLNLTINNSESSTFLLTVCDYYIWNGNTYSSSGNYTDTLTSSVTGCDSIVTLSLTINLDSAPYLEDFDNGLSLCWTNNSSDALDWSINSGGTTSSNTGPSDDITGGGNYIYMETSGSSAGDSAMLSTGKIDISSLTNPALRMYSHMYGGSIGELSVWITDAAGTMNQVFVKNGDQGDQWVVEYIDLAGYTGIVNFTILGVNSSTATGVAYQGDIAIDNFEIMELPSCIDPSGLIVSNILSTTADISWSNPSTTVTLWNYVYDTAGFDPLLGTPVSTANIFLTASLSGLNTSTSYDVYVQSDCGTNVGTWIGPISFTTSSSCNISVSAGADQTVCEADNFQLSASFLQGANYSWSPTTGLSNPFVRSPNGYLNSSTTYTVTCSLNGCVYNDQVTITVQPSPNINLSSNQTICLGDQVILDAIGANNISWNNGVSNTVPFYPTQSSYYTVSGDNSYGCVSEDSVLVTVNPLPNVNAGQDVNVCAGSAAILIASGANNYVWNNNIINGQSFVPLGSSNYIVIGTDNNGCVNSDTVKVTINPLPNVNAGSDQTICLGDDVTLSASGANSYSWTNGVVNNVAFVPTSPHPDFISSIDYSVTGTSNYGCTNTDIVKVIINPLPDIYAYSFVNGVNNNSSEVYLCSGDSVRLYGDGAGIGTYEWDNGVMDNEWFTPTNSNIYTLTGTRDFTGCSNTDQITLTVNELPEIVETIINEEFGDDGSISIDVIAGTPPFDFDWDVDGLGDNDDFQDLTDLKGGTYVLIVTDDNGCKSRFTIVLENMTSLVIPSAITPNGDGVNDVWDIKGLNGYPEMQLQIFDRNGVLLHEQQGLYTDWDGIYAGKQLPEGDYFYIIDLKNGRQPYMGAVSIKF